MDQDFIHLGGFLVQTTSNPIKATTRGRPSVIRLCQKVSYEVPSPQSVVKLHRNWYCCGLVLFKKNAGGIEKIQRKEEGMQCISFEVCPNMLKVI